MKKFFLMAVFLIVVATSVFAVSDKCNPAKGALWTTTSYCGDPQDANSYVVGETVYVHASGYCEGIYNATVTGNPGGSSCDPGSIVADTSVIVDLGGEFCFPIYEIAQGDCGEYKVTVGPKTDNYRVEESEVPEFTTIGALIAGVGAVAAYTYSRKIKR